MGREPLKVSHNSGRLGSHKDCASGDIMFLVCQLIAEDHVTKEKSNPLGRSGSKLVTMLQSLVVIDTVVVEI